MVNAVVHPGATQDRGTARKMYDDSFVVPE